MGEVELAAVLCLMLGGDAEVPHHYSVATGVRSIRVDCETETHVIEVSLDKRSSFDSLHQAVVAAELTGKMPKVILINTKGVEDGEEWQIELASRAVGIEYQTYTRDYLIRWQMTAAFRDRKIELPGLVPTNLRQTSAQTP